LSLIVIAPSDTVVRVDEPVDNRWITCPDVGVTGPSLWMNKET
jgi:hypothetical protein